MAIEISKKTKIRVPLWAVALGIVCLALILVLAGSYFYLNILTGKITKEIQDKEEALKITPSQKSLEDNLSLTGNKIDQFADLASKHRKVANIFTFIENTCLPNIQFSDFNFDIAKETVNISGQTDSFVALGQELNILKQEALIKKINLSGVSINDEGTVDFTFSIIFSPDIFK